MSDHQTYAMALFLFGVAVLILSMGIAWTLSRVSRTRREDSAWFVTAVSFALFIVGVVLCWFGVSAFVEG